MLMLRIVEENQLFNENVASWYKKQSTLYCDILLEVDECDMFDFLPDGLEQFYGKPYKITLTYYSG